MIDLQQNLSTAKIKHDAELPTYLFQYNAQMAVLLGVALWDNFVQKTVQDSQAT
jgi:hypothetical protein